MRVLVLSWDAHAHDGGLAPQAAGLATALAAGGHDVRVVTRLAEDGTAPELEGVEVHAAADAPPIVPPGLDDPAGPTGTPPVPPTPPVLPALAFAARALSVAVRRLEERAVDVVHAEGWQTGPVAEGLRTSHDVRVLAALDAADVASATGQQLASDAEVVACRSRADRAALAAAGVPAELLPPAAVLAPDQRPRRRPGPPPAAGPLHLVTAPGADHRRTARAVRAALAQPRTVTGSWARRPFAVVVLDPHDLTAALHAMALGVPVLAVPGPAAELATDTGAGVVLDADDDGAAVRATAAAVRQLEQRPDRAAALGAAGVAAAAERTAAAAAAAWLGLAERVVMESAGSGHLHAAD